MENEVYGYARVSTKEQNLARQLEQLREFGIPERNIKCDKISGKTFNRMEYNALVGTKETAPLLRKGDLLVIVSLDRLGRNYTEIREQWNYIINGIGADIVVLDEISMLSNSQIDMIRLQMKPGSILLLLGDKGQLPALEDDLLNNYTIFDSEMREPDMYLNPNAGPNLVKLRFALE